MKKLLPLLPFNKKRLFRYKPAQLLFLIYKYQNKNITFVVNL